MGCTQTLAAKFNACSLALGLWGGLVRGRFPTRRRQLTVFDVVLGRCAPGCRKMCIMQKEPGLRVSR